MKEKFLKTSSLTSNISNNFESSLWCNSKGHKKLCTFKNLCYVPRENVFAFILTNNSILDGVTDTLELKEIDLSSVINHNRFSLKLAVITQDSSILRRTRIVIKYGFILWRFKWDNIMHVIHDDLLPLYMTYNLICTGNINKCASKYQLAFADEGEFGTYADWYSIFSSSEPILLQKSNRDSIICFDESRVGLVANSLWFQYGFGIPQGPLLNSQFNGKLLQKFCKYILHKYDIPSIEAPQSNKIIFFSRKINRKILNEAEVITMITEEYKTTFNTNSSVAIAMLDLATNNTRNILTLLSQSQIVVGMHGSAMILSIFLKPGSVVVELFPFGINPNYVSPVKALSELPDTGIIYSYWTNRNETNTVTNPNAPPLLGGISHLPLSEQNKIMNIREIPAVECCHNPAYLYRMFQDTVVDEDLSVTLKNAFMKQKLYSVENFYDNSGSQMFSQWYFPAPVTGISCEYSIENQTLSIVWNPPVNTKQPQYHVAIVSNIKEFSTKTTQSELIVSFPKTLQKIGNIDIWIKSIEREKESLDSYFQCNIDN
ncbi:hypothetical protein L9F63_007136 [Diploptera punctata]|uniref:Glycosyltransferase 61 catalytic domain-containing protein n=1 Tax=Diploptera punctata TaxID=6984 RepID=A0AAD7Z8T6_DIPPU|nr:hypothetical protein L9F63_007136 [Diploptera punctata]